MDFFWVCGPPGAVAGAVSPDHTDAALSITRGEDFFIYIEPVLLDGFCFCGVPVDAEVADFVIVGGLAVEDEGGGEVHGF